MSKVNRIGKLGILLVGDKKPGAAYKHEKLCEQKSNTCVIRL